jgi:hypothetical protein
MYQEAILNQKHNYKILYSFFCAILLLLSTFLQLCIVRVSWVGNSKLLYIINYKTFQKEYTAYTYKI